MAQAITYVVTPVKDLYPSEVKGLAFLHSPEDAQLDALKTYDALGKKVQQNLKNRFDYWVRGGVRDDYFHGWRDLQNRECFAFKWKQKAQRHRFYGFLINPRPRTAARFRVCILVSHAQKNTEHTDPAELKRANLLRQKAEVIEAIKKAYPELDLH